ncbi:hypothetical protein K2173_023554 [Erythroxylum novogranatense]|uniref:Cytochrome b5 heme-binding domain-containing protein n=1 Tax=Erythroxylum novogranatense TaxID=1862640 RepID=A0AAV8TQW3_9ROSI|nr:hypothetical protein K2173_023554 [Erythroxylum novogranatense]
MVLAALALILGVLLGGLLLIPRYRKLAHTEKASSNSGGVKVTKTYSKAEVSLHNRRTDCWIIIKDKVYDVTSYVEEHPGGDAILAHAGDDSTEGFYGYAPVSRLHKVHKNLCVSCFCKDGSLYGQDYN